MLPLVSFLICHFDILILCATRPIAQVLLQFCGVWGMFPSGEGILRVKLRNKIAFFPPFAFYSHYEFKSWPFNISQFTFHSLCYGISCFWLFFFFFVRSLTLFSVATEALKNTHPFSPSADAQDRVHHLSLFLLFLVFLPHLALRAGCSHAPLTSLKYSSLAAMWLILH